MLTEAAVLQYVETEHTKVKEISFEKEISFQDLTCSIFSVKTDDDKNWWVIGGDLPMNLYSKSETPSSFHHADEAFSMHIGLMFRLSDR